MKHVFMKLGACIAVMVIALLPVMPVIASDISDADFYGIIQTTNNGTAASAVASNVSGLNTSELIAAGYLNASANNCAIRSSSGTDMAFMPGYGSSPWMLFFGLLGADSISNSIAYFKNVTGGSLAWFPASAGGNITDVAGMEPGNAFSDNLTAYVDTTQLGETLISKPLSYQIAVDNVTAGKVNFDLLGDNTTALDFEQSNSDYVSIPDSDNYSFTDGAGNDLPFTITGWYKPEANAGGQYILTKLYTAATYEWDLLVAGTGEFRAQLWNSTGATGLDKTTTATLTDAVWAHVAVTYDGSETVAGIKLYLNGVYQSSTTNSTTGAYAGMSNTAALLEFSRVRGGDAATGYIDGTLSNWQIYKNRQLSDAEILADYNFTLYGANLVGWYKFTDGAGNPADSSGLAHNATANNADWVTTGNKAYLAKLLSLTGIASGENTYYVSLAGGTLTLTAGSSTNTTAFAGSLANSSDNFTIGSDATIYIERYRHEVSGVLRCDISWEYDTVFTDASANGNDLTPTFRTTSSDADVSSVLVSFQPIAEPTAPAFAVGEGPGFFDSSNVTTGNFTTGNVTLDYPLKDLIEDVATAGGVPYQIPSTFISSFCVIVLSMLTSFFLKRYSAQSIFLKTIVNTAAYGVLIALHIYDWWMLIFFFIFEASIWFGAQHRRE